LNLKFNHPPLHLGIRHTKELGPHAALAPEPLGADAPAQRMNSNGLNVNFCPVCDFGSFLNLKFIGFV
jgi:hypothetical protein